MLYVLWRRRRIEAQRDGECARADAARFSSGLGGGRRAGLAAGVVRFVLFGAPQLLDVVALDGLVQRQLRQRVVDREPLPLAAHQPRVFPLRQLLGHRHHVHFCSVFVFPILEIQTKHIHHFYLH